MNRRFFVGFTLIELLVVMLVVGLLAMLFFPVFLSVRRAGQRTVCLNNLHQIGAAFSLYADDHDGQFPNTGDVYLWTGRQWRPVLDPYVGNKKSFWCPGDQEAKQKFDSTSYAYMQTFYHADDDITAGAVTTSTPVLLAYRTCGWTTQMRCQSEVFHPSEKIMVYEWATNHDAPLRSMWDPTGAHNALFADGHVAVVKEETIKQSALGDHDPNWTIDGLAGKDVE